MSDFLPPRTTSAPLRVGSQPGPLRSQNVPHHNLSHMNDIPRHGLPIPNALPKHERTRQLWEKIFESHREDLSDAVAVWLREQWDSFGTAIDSIRPEHLCIGNRAMLGEHAAATGRQILIRDRTLPHQIRGILSRVTPENYDSIRKELLDLPVRQSEESEITEIVEVFFKKAIRPEDSIYAPQYAQLIAALVLHIEDVERERKSSVSVAQNIRRAVIKSCQGVYESMPLLREKIQNAPTNNQSAEFEFERKQTVDMLKANIKFLGQLFVNNMVRENIVVMVLYSLLYGNDRDGRQRNRGEVQDYEIDQFFALIEVVGSRLSEEMKTKYTTSFCNSLQDIQDMNVQMRTKVVALNCKEFIERGFRPRNAAMASGPRKLEEHSRMHAQQKSWEQEQLKRQHQENAVSREAPQGGNKPTSLLRRQPSAVSTGITSPTTPPVRVALTPDVFKKKMDSLLKKEKELDAANEPSQTDAIEITEFRDALSQGCLQKGELLTYLVSFFFRHTATRYATERTVFSQRVLPLLCTVGILSKADIATFFSFLLEDFMCQYEDNPKYEEKIVELVQANVDFFGANVLNTFLGDITARVPGEPMRLLKRVVGAFSKLDTHNARQRFRPLPQLLRYTYYRFADDNEEEDRCDDVDEDEEELDVLDEFEEVHEVSIYCSLFLNAKVLSSAVTADIKFDKNDKKRKGDKGDLMAERQTLSSAFTFARYSRRVIDKVVSQLASMFKLYQNDADIQKALLLEVYDTWVDCERQPPTAMEDFLNSLSTHVKTIYDDSIATVRRQIQTEEGAGTAMP